MTRLCVTLIFDNKSRVVLFSSSPYHLTINKSVVSGSESRFIVVAKVLYLISDKSKPDNNRLIRSQYSDCSLNRRDCMFMFYVSVSSLLQAWWRLKFIGRATSGTAVASVPSWQHKPQDQQYYLLSSCLFVFLTLRTILSRDHV